MTIRFRPLIPVSVVLLVVLDQITKLLADKMISPVMPIRVMPFFNLVNIKNTGAAFGLFSSLGSIFFIVMSTFAIFFIIYLLIKGKESSLGLSLILSGAIGNLIDRVFLGYVRDFADFHYGGLHWPAFNVADSALTVGVIVLVFDALLINSEKKQEIS